MKKGTCTKKISENVFLYKMKKRTCTKRTSGKCFFYIE